MHLLLCIIRSWLILWHARMLFISARDMWCIEARVWDAAGEPTMPSAVATPKSVRNFIRSSDNPREKKSSREAVTRSAWHLIAALNAGQRLKGPPERAEGPLK